MSSPIHAAAPIDLDLRGLRCPLPVLRARKALRRVASGDSLAVHCTDLLAAIDIPHMLRQDGHRLISHSVADGVSTFLIVKGEEIRSMRPPAT